MASERMLKIYERDGRNTSSNDPKMMEARVFIGNLPADLVTRQAVEKLYEGYGKILGISLHKSYGFVQFDNEESATQAVKATHGSMMHGKRLGELKQPKKCVSPVGVHYLEYGFTHMKCQVFCFCRC